ncbi:hypothetical protein CHU93_15325 [Sandarakinorhabdus cyanobacteriorum]|uniref:Ice-binding protein C-terminal domain-containing protein n=1 Tax=Sandarakinorhabdus cyanobacteriorum TaxID=1981098 RepID=A0A255Y6B3_9SPHN|nr:hypothetical protein CHU93_15325 [Sandarakinorhabdus cyanobacteriorum]
MGVLVRQYNLLLAVLLVATAGSAQATTSITTSAFGLHNTVRALGVAGADVGPLAEVSGTTSPGYAVTGEVLSHSSQTGLGVAFGDTSAPGRATSFDLGPLVSTSLNLSAGLIATAANANGTTPLDTSSGDASAVVNNFNLGLVTTTFGTDVPIITLSATQLRSQTQVQRTGITSSLSGSSEFTNLSLAVDGFSIITLGSNASVAANHVVYNLGGLSIVMNEQVSTGVLGGIERFVTNAMRISFNNYLVGGQSLSGDVIIAQSAGQMLIDPGAVVPEPATWLQMILGFGLVGLLARRKLRVA